MANTNTKTAEDKAKGMNWEFEVESLSGNVNAVVKSTLVRDPGTKKEVRMSPTKINVQLNMHGPVATPEELAATLKANPLLVPIMAAILDDLVKQHSFEA